MANARGRMRIKRVAGPDERDLGVGIAVIGSDPDDEVTPPVSPVLAHSNRRIGDGTV